MTAINWKSSKKDGATQRSYMMIESVRWNVHLQSHIWSPPTDLLEYQNEYVVRVEISGMHQHSFSIEIEDKFLIVKGNRPEPSGKKAFHQMEIRFGDFSSIVAIPELIDEKNSSAEYLDGFLLITLPKLTINE